MNSKKPQHLICYGPTTLVFTLPHRTKLTKAVKNDLAHKIMQSEFGKTYKVDKATAVAIVNSGKLIESLPEKINYRGKDTEVLMMGESL